MPSISITARMLRDGCSAKTQCAILPVFTGGKLSEIGTQLDSALGGVIQAALAMGDFSGAQGKTLLLPGSTDVKRVLLVGLGDRRKFDCAAQRAGYQSSSVYCYDSSRSQSCAKSNGSKDWYQH